MPLHQAVFATFLGWQNLLNTDLIDWVSAFHVDFCLLRLEVDVMGP